MSLPLPFWLSLRENGPLAIYTLSDLDQRLSRLNLLKSPTPLTPSLRGFSHTTPALTAPDLMSLGFFIHHSQDGQSFVKLNPWFHTWLFDHIPALRRERSIHFKSRFLAQATYDLVVPPDLAWPSFLQLISLASGEVCDLVCHLKLSKKSVHHGITAGVDPSEIIPFFEHHAWSLPDNVKRSLLDWIHAHDSEHAHTGATPTRTARDERDLFPIEEMRKQLNTLMATSLHDWLHPKRKGAREALSIVGLSAPEKIVLPKTPTHPESNTPQDPSADVSSQTTTRASPILNDALPPDFRENLFLIEDCIRRKHLLKILHRPRENREKWRTILPLRLQRDGVAIFLEAHCQDMDVIRSFKLNQILEVKLA